MLGKTSIVMLVGIFTWRTSFGQASSEAVLWIEYAAKYRAKDWSFMAGIQYRPFLDREQQYQMVYGGEAGYSLNPNVKFTVAAEALINYLYVEGQSFSRPVYQPSQAVALQFPLENIRFKWQLKIEERFFKELSECGCVTENGYLYATRFRLLSEVFIPLSDQLELQTGTEVMVQAGDWVQSTFDQNRTVVLLRRSFGRLTVRAGYMHWLFRAQSGNFENRHTFRFGIFHTFR